MPRETLVRYGDSALLNKPTHHSIAAIATNLFFSDGAKYVDGSISISDCYKAITLELEYGEGEGEFTNAVHKVDTLIAVLSKLRVELIAARGVQLKNIEETKKKKEKEDVED